LQPEKTHLGAGGNARPFFGKESIMKLNIIYDYFVNRFGSRLATLESIDINDVDFHELLAKVGRIAVIWSIEDIKDIRPDLSDEQAWDVLEEVERKHDAEYGINWDTLEDFADQMFPNLSADGRVP
jgi:hypothetical protein